VTSQLWDRNNPLFFYGNEEKLNDLTGRIFGEVTTAFQASSKEGAKASMKLAAKFGGFLSALGLGEASGELGAEVNSEDTKTRISSITFDAKLNAMSEYCHKNERFPYIDVVNGVALERGSGRAVSQWRQRALTEADRVDQIGHVLGLFKPTRVIPPHDTEANIAGEFMQQKKHLWNFQTIEGSSIRSEVPVLLSNTRLTSQHALLAVTKMMATDFKIEALGLLTWREGLLTCDPVAWRLYY
jgi:hypothetical protein